MQESVTVRQLCGVMEHAMDALFPDEVWVRGTISGLTRSRNGHVYFDLIDAEEEGRQPSAVLPVALFANAKHRVNAILKKSANAIRMEDGIEIQIRGRVAYYPKQSRIQLIMSLIDPAFTLGLIEANRSRVLATLHADGLLDRNKAIPMPALPLRIGLVTSSGSAADADFRHELELSGLPFEVIALDARVQGDEAVATIVRALERAIGLEIDVIAIVRGGGARTDLMAFDDEAVARAIASQRVPVVTGIGHEVDRAIADEVAHLAAKTPTACAGVFIEQVLSSRDRVERAAERIGRLADSALTSAGDRLAVARSELIRLATAAVDQQNLHVELLHDRIRRGAVHCLERSTARLDRAEIRARALDPATTMARGWSITRRGDGSILRSVDQTEAGEVLLTTLADGTVRSTVIGDD